MAAQRRSPVAVPVVGIDGTDRLPGSGWRVHNQVSMPRNLRFCSHDVGPFPPIDTRDPFRVTFSRGGSSPSNCFIRFFKLYVIVRLFVRFERSISNI